MSDMIASTNVFLNVEAKSVDDVLEFLSGKAVELGYADDKAAVLASFKHREELGSTGMADGFAIPHAKDDAIKHPGILVAKLAGDVAWKSTDDVPVTTAIGLLMPGAEAGTTHLLVLAKVSSMLMHEDARKKIAESDDPAAIAAVIADAVK